MSGHSLLRSDLTPQKEEVVFFFPSHIPSFFIKGFLQRHWWTESNCEHWHTCLLMACRKPPPASSSDGRICPDKWERRRLESREKRLSSALSPLLTSNTTASGSFRHAGLMGRPRHAPPCAVCMFHHMLRYRSYGYTIFFVPLSILFRIWLRLIKIRSACAWVYMHMLNLWYVFL